MKITMYELIGLIKDNKAPKKIKINEDILNLEIGKELSYRFENRCASLGFGYYIDTNKLDYEIEILDKDFKLEETTKISKLYINNELQYNLKEEKKICKLKDISASPEYCYTDTKNYHSKEIREMIRKRLYDHELYMLDLKTKINEIIDCLNSKGE